MSSTDFNQRVRRIAREHERIKQHGGDVKLQRDGLLKLRPRRAVPLRRAPLKLVLMVLVGLFAGKCALIWHLGDDAYAAKLAALDSDSIVERGGALVMQIDPASRWIVDQLARVTG
ncbi:hypothetical protein OG2516_07712 [Oceanicola granulosus HTCC2516]|uniref:Uncharacterized protein n=1 Tax=Oceanicola granulosus (strain ATCC BAA-861 / DSM 15982 / KCTC 12143 / HTCC2516) TaxID=314256 RepID=Q2CIB2_OCEGH|nr:hypothetical protein [Oceanicola granulosus]EAR52346.1 hypothetical protein OG2516_07712 [Oceanicola granulosus HTCC2516]